MREDYLIAMANLVNGSLLGYEDRSRVPEYEKTVDDYVDSLEKENQEYKEVLDKLENKIKVLKQYDFDRVGRYELLDILKEVE